MGVPTAIHGNADLVPCSKYELVSPRHCWQPPPPKEAMRRFHHHQRSY